jgi:hypothetical protein
LVTWSTLAVINWWLDCKGCSLPGGVRLVTWTTLAVIDGCFDCKMTL